ncbi:MAG: HYR domain-containing protein [Saprospiraceae bacterium]|nr:HYR domain-containing protein [Saprospiraceae bacterium]
MKNYYHNNTQLRKQNILLNLTQNTMNNSTNRKFNLDLINNTTTKWSIKSLMLVFFIFGFSVSGAFSQCPVTISGNLNVSQGCSTTLTADQAGSYLWSTGATTQSIIVSPVFSTLYSVTLDGSCSASETVNVSGPIEISEVCACDDGSGNISFAVTFTNWPTCGGPFTTAINYTNNTAGTSITSLGGVTNDPSGIKTVIFNPVANALLPAGNLSMSSVVNPANQAQSVSAALEPYTVTAPIAIVTCAPNQNVFTEVGVCYGLVPDLTGSVVTSGGCGSVTITQSPLAGTQFGTACGNQQVVTITVMNSGCGTTVTCNATLTLVDDQDPVITTAASTSATVSCPSETDTPPALPVVTDNCAGIVSPGAPVISDLPTCNGSRTYTYTYDDGCGNDIVWVFTYNVVYSGGLTAPAAGTATVSCPSGATDPGAPASITDACGRTVNAVLVGSTSTPDPVTCEGTVVWTYRYTACDGTTTADWTYTYTVDYSGALTAPANGSGTVSCPSDATDPGAPAPITDACGRTVSAVLVGSTSTPDPVTCEGTVVWTYRYTACDGTTTADWTYTYTVDYSGPLGAPAPGLSTVSCPSQATDPGAPTNINDFCGRPISAQFVSRTPATGPDCEGTVVYLFRYTACDGITTVDWTYTYTIDYSGGLTAPDNTTASADCLADITAPQAPVNISDACGRTVIPAFIGVTDSPDPLTCNGTRVYLYRYTACDGTTTADWTHTVTLSAPAVELIVPTNTTEAACLSQAAIDAAYSLWISGVTYNGGCNSSISDDSAGPPDACGGDVTVTWTVSSDCEVDVVESATFTVSPCIYTGSIALTTAGIKCEGTNFDLTFTSTGLNGPFTIVVNGTTYNNVSDGGSISVSGTSPTTTYELTSITDVNGCEITGSPISSVVVDLNVVPTVVVDELTEYCVMAVLTHSAVITPAAPAHGSYGYTWCAFASNDCTGTCFGSFLPNANVASPTRMWDTSSPNRSVSLNVTTPGCANAADCEAFSIVPDPIAPVITRDPNTSPACPDITLTVTVTAGTGGTGTCVDEYRYSTDNGANWTAWSATVPSFTSVIGTNLVESRRNCDALGCNSNVNQVSWIIEDVTPPMLVGTLPSDETGLNLCFANIPVGPTEEFIEALYTDNCGDVIVTKSGTPSGDNCSWTVIYTYEIEDEYGNSAPDFLLTYSGGDSEPPMLTGTLPGGNLGNVCESSAPAAPSEADIAALYTDNCGGIVVTLLGPSGSTDGCTWERTYTYSVVDGCGIAAPNAVVTYTGTDTGAPTGSAPDGTSNINACYIDDSTVPIGTPSFDATAAAAGYTDLCGSPVSATLTGTTVSGNNCGWTVTYTFSVSDGCSNTLPGQTIVHTGSDQTIPVITLTGPASVNLCEGATYADLGATASDNCFGDISGDIVVDASAINNNVPGVYTVTYNVSDLCSNNAVEVSRQVTVQANPTFGFSAQASPGGTVQTGNNNSGNATITVDFCAGENLILNNFTRSGNNVGFLEKLNSTGNTTSNAVPVPANRAQTNISPAAAPAFFNLPPYPNYNLSSGSFGSITQTFTPYIDLDNSGTFTPGDCLGDTITLVYNIYAIPNVSADPKTICSGESTDLTVNNPNAVPGATFTWTASYGAVTGGSGAGSGSFGAGAISETLVNITPAPIDVTYTITPVGPSPRNCEGTPIMVVVTVRPALMISCPDSETTGPCFGSSDFGTWLSSFTFSGGFNATGGFDNSPTAPDNCGGSEEVTYIVSDDCGVELNCTRTFTILDAPAVVLTCPSNLTVAANLTQAAINTAFTDWINDASVSGGCGTSLVMNNAGAAPDRCVGGTVTVTFTVTSDCEADVTCERTFTVPPSTLDAQISGMASICTGGSLFLNGNPSGGNAPYTHAWSVLGTSTGSGTFGTPTMSGTPFTANTPGTIDILYVVTDASGCTSSSTATLFVPAECNYEFTINDPCVCNNDAQVNADNGTFMELVVVTGPNGAVLPAGQIWTINSVFGAYSASPLNEEFIPGPQGAPLATGQVFAYCANPAGCLVYNSAAGTQLNAPFGSYYLSFAHVDQEGYTMTVEGPAVAGDLNNTILNVSNVCFYPALSIVAPTVACDTDGPITFQGIPNAVTAASSPYFAGDATFVGGQPPYSYAAQAGLTNTGNGAATFDPGVAGFGSHVISYSFEGNPAPNSSSPGCWSAVEFTFDVKATLTLTANVVNEGCEGVANGLIDLTVTPSGAIDPALYTFIWSNGATTEDINGLATGNYSVTVTHPDACTQVASYFVNAIPNPTPVLVVSGNGQFTIPQCVPAGPIIFQGTVLDCDITSASSAFLIGSRLSIVGVPGLIPFPTYVDTEDGFAYFEFTGIVPPGQYLAFVTYNDGVNSVTVDVLLQVLQDPDSENPEITCDAAIVANVDVDACNSEQTLILPAVSDNCPAAGIVITYGVVNPDNSYSGPFASTATSYVFNVGNSTIIWQATDAAGNFSTCVQNVTITDNIDPVITCATGSPFTRDNTNGECGYIADDDEFDAIATDNCPGVVVTHNYAAWGNANSLAGATFPVGTTTVVWTATDINGNTTTCEIEITVNDTENPVFVNCPNTTFTIGADADCNNGVIWSIPIATDNCDGVVVTQTGGPILGSQLVPGTYMIQYTASDAATPPNTAVCNFTINVVDDSDPLLVCLPSFTIGTDDGVCSWTSEVGELNPLLSVDNCPNQVLTYVISGATVGNGTGAVPVTEFNLGVTTVIYVLTDENNNAVTCTFDITVIDDEAPVIVNCGNPLFSGTDGPFANTTGDCSRTLNGGLVVTENCDLAPTVQMLVENPDGTLTLVNWVQTPNTLNYTITHTFQVGVSTYTIVATDSNGNSSVCVWQMVVNDTETPELTCPAGSPFTRANTTGVCGYTAVGTEFDATATDNCPDYTLSHNYYSWANPTSLAGATFPIGTTNVTWTVTDASGNATNCTITVIVTDSELPVANCQPQIDAVLDGDGLAQIVVSNIELGSTDNCGIASYAISRVGGTFGPSLYVTCADLPPNGSDVIVTLRVTDTAGNTNICTTTVDVYDLEIPNAECRDTTIYVDAAGDASITAAELDGGSSDNCSITSLAINVSDFTCANIGDNNVTLTVTDLVGNIGVCVSTVTVRDTIRPTFTCPAPVVVESCEDVVPDLVALVTDAADNCAVATILQNPVAGGVIGVTDGSGFLVTITVTDVNGNTRTCDVSVTVMDETPPVAICQPQMDAVLDGDGLFQITTAMLNIESYDDCGGVVSLAISRDGTNFVPSFLVSCTDIVVPTTNVVTGTLLVTDLAGNTATCTTIINVLDLEIPNAECRDTTIYVDAAGDASITAAELDGGSSDNCSITSLVINVSDFTCANIGDNNVTLTVTDFVGNIGVCVSTVTVRDTIRPTFTCPAPVVVESCEDVVPDLVALVTDAADNCAVATILQNPVAGGVIGVTDGSGFLVTITVTDVNGNTRTCDVSVTVMDETPPVAICQPQMDAVLDGDGLFQITTAMLNIESYDDCGGVVSLSISRDGTNFVPSFLVSCTDIVVPTTNVVTGTLLVTDLAGNTATCTTVINVLDLEIPNAECRDTTIYVDAAGDASITAAELDGGSSDNCSITSLVINVSDFTCANIGDNNVTLTVTDFVGNIGVCVSTVTVRDTIRPTFTCPAPVVVESCEDVVPDLVALVTDAADNCAVATILQNPVAGGVIGVTDGSGFLVTITVTDVNGNTRTCDVSVTVMDETPPVAICQPQMDAVLDGDGLFQITTAMLNIESYDDCGGVVSLAISRDGTNFVPSFLVNCTDIVVGTTNVVTGTLLVTDLSGNTATCTTVINVLDLEMPNAECRDTTIYVDAAGDASITAAELDGGSSDNCSITSLAINVSDFTCVNIGDNSVTLTVTDFIGNIGVCVSTVTVRDTIRPTFTCPADFVASSCNNVVPDLVALVTDAADNCGVATITQNPVAGSVIGQTDGSSFLVTITVTDVNGNTRTCNVSVSIEDTTPPVFVNCPVEGYITDVFTNDCVTGANWSIPVATDDCGVISITQTEGPTRGTLIAPGMYMIEYTATDANDNTTTCSFMVDVLDTERPVIVCPDNIVTGNDDGECGAIVEFVVEVNDNCELTFGQDLSINQNASQAIVDAIDCPSPSLVNHARLFDLSGVTGDVTLSEITFGVRQSLMSGANVTVNVYSIVDGLALATANLNLVETQVFAIPANTNNQLFNLNSTAVITDGNSIVLEVITPGNPQFVMGYNYDAQTGPSYIKNSICGAPEYANLVTLGFTNFAVVLSAIGQTQGEADLQQIAGLPSGSFFPVGTTINTFVLTDNAGNTSSCSFSVTVEDREGPAFTCPGAMNVAGCAGVVPSVITGLTGTDNCDGIVTFTQNPVAGTLFGPDPGDMILVTVTATDVVGNTTTCTVELTIIDTEMPYFVNCPQNQLVYSNDPDLCSATVNWSIPVAMDNCTNVMAPTQIVQTMGSAPGSVFPVGGPYTIEYTATDEDGNSMTCQWTFIVVDTQEPEILVGKPQNETVGCDNVPAPLVLNPNDVEDNCTPNPTIAFVQQSTQSPNQALCAHYDYTLTNIWTVTDAAGNAQVWNQVVTVVDTVAPAITLPVNVTVECNGQYVTKSFVCNPATGMYAPTAANVMVNGVNTGIATALDNCAPTQFICIEFTEVFEPGTCGFTGLIRRTWTATDPCGNRSTGVQLITIVDTTPPVFTCQDITVNLDATGNVTIGAGQIIVGGIAAVTENCSAPGDITFQMSQTQFTCANIGVNQVMLIVTDDCGNSAACLANVTVRDVTPPVIACPANVTISLAPGDCRGYISNGANATDNCSSTITYSPSISQPFEIGVTTVTATATDAGGNTSTCTFTVTVIEFIPVSNSMTCNNALNLSLDGNCEAVINADMILEGSNYRCYEKYCIEIATAAGLPHANFFTLADVGKTFTVRITDCLGDGNNCWGYVTVEEKLIPEIECPDDLTVSCAQDLNARNAQGRLITGEARLITCEPGSVITYSDNFVDNGQCGTPRGVVFRTWVVTDLDGNSASCVQTLTISSLNLNDIVWPADKDFADALECNDVALNPLLTTPAFTGWPTLNGIQVNRSGNLCMVSVNVSDELYDVCPGSYEILRTWKVRNMCLPLSSTNPLTHVQIIKVLDTEGPKIATCPEDITISTDAWGCLGGTFLPIPEKIEDLCSNVSFKAVLFGSGKVTVTGSIAAGNLRVQLTQLPKGTHVVRYEFSDECGNVTACNFTVTVRDLVAPIAISKQDIVIGLTPGFDADGIQDAQAKLFAESVDNGSFDNCSGVRLEVRRAIGPDCGNEGAVVNPTTGLRHNNNRTFSNRVNLPNYSPNDTDGGEFVKFCCEDLDAIVVDANGDGLIDELDRGYHEVILRVWDDGNMNGIIGDAGDNWSEIWSYVKVEAKVPPVIVCPDDATIHCDWAIETRTTSTSIAGIDFSKTGLPTAYGVCSNPNITFQDVLQLNQCGIGIINRTFTISDMGTTRQCVQRITVAQSTSQQEWVVTPPSASIPEVGCDGPTEAQIKANQPTWVSGPCDVIGVSHKVLEFEFEDGVCKKWVVEYKLVNWCDNEERGPYTKQFVYKDPTPPVIEMCRDTMFAVDANCELVGLTLTKRATDAGGCINDGWIKWVIVVDLWADGTPDYEWSSFLPVGNDVNNANTGNFAAIQDNNGNGIKDIYVAPTVNGGTVSIRIPEPIVGKMSNHKITWKATDGCHNYVTCHEDFMVVDKKAPTPVCVPLSTALMADPDGSGPMVPMVELWAIDFNVKSTDNCTEEEELLYTFDQTAPQVEDKVVFTRLINIDIPHYFDKTGGLLRFPADMTNAQQRAIVEKYLRGEENSAGNGVIQLWNPATRSSAKVWTDRELEEGTNKGEAQVMMSVWDKKFNTDFCWTSLKLICTTCPGGETANISGSARTELNQGVNGVEVQFESILPEFPRTYTTNQTGTYSMNLMTDFDYGVSAKKDGNYLEGVSTLDLVMIQRHILGLESLNSAYKVIAADANNNGRVTAADLTELRKLILGVTNALPNQTSWRFPVKDQILELSNPFPYTEQISVSPLLVDVTGQDFVAVKIGDVNGSASVSVQDAQLESRSSKALKLEIEDRAVKAGEVVTIPVLSSNYADVYGYQFTLGLNGAEFAGITAGAINVTDQNVGVLRADQVTMSYASGELQSADINEVLFTIIVKATRATTISEILQLNSEVTKTESYVGTAMEINNVTLGVRTAPIAGEEEGVAELFQNEPNPFRGMTTVSYYLPENASTVLTVFDVTGKVVAIRKADAVKGMNAETFTMDQLGASGVYYYKLESGEFNAVKKMILVE